MICQRELYSFFLGGGVNLRELRVRVGESLRGKSIQFRWKTAWEFNSWAHRFLEGV